MTTGSEIDYHALQQDAMRGVVRSILSKVATDGLPGEHHFYISFLTEAPGAILSKRLKQKYPHDMTIVLQHRFWDLIVSEDRFEVKLTFDGVPERLVIPYRAIKIFIDPSVGFGLQFEDPDSDGEIAPTREMTIDATLDSVGAAHAEGPRPPKKTRTRRTRSDKDAAEKDQTPSITEASGASPPFPESAAAAAQRGSAEKNGGENAVANPAAIEGGAKIFSLDQFRKK